MSLHTDPLVGALIDAGLEFRSHRPEEAFAKLEIAAANAPSADLGRGIRAAAEQLREVIKIHGEALAVRRSGDAKAAGELREKAKATGRDYQLVLDQGQGGAVDLWHGVREELDRMLEDDWKAK